MNRQDLVAIRMVLRPGRPPEDGRHIWDFLICTRSDSLADMKIFRVMATVVAVVATMLVGAYQASAQQGGAYGTLFGDLTISGVGSLGATITLSGDGFASSTSLSITFSSNESGSTVRQEETSSDSQGAFSQDLVIDEQTPPGTYTVTVQGPTVDGATRQLSGALVIEEDLDASATPTTAGSSEAGTSDDDSDDSGSTDDDASTGTSDDSAADTGDAGDTSDAGDEAVGEDDGGSADEDAAGSGGDDGGSSSGVWVFVWIVVAVSVLGGGLLVLRAKGKLGAG